MKEYGEEEYCPKCHSTRFHWTNGENKDTFSLKYCKSTVVDGVCRRPKKDDDASEELRTEHLHVTCDNCGYEWIENVYHAG